MDEIVYVLTNEAMPDLVKIGRTAGSSDNVETRMAQLYSTPGVPLPFDCYFAAKVRDAARTERTLHELFSDKRINKRREFFSVDPEKVVLAISLGDFEEVTPGAVDITLEEKQAAERAKERRPRLKMTAIGIQPGDILTFSRDESMTATVVQDNKIELDGEILSLSESALRLLQGLGYTTPTAQGSKYWMFEGELLDERRRRIEAETFDERDGDG